MKRGMGLAAVLVVLAIGGRAAVAAPVIPRPGATSSAGGSVRMASPAAAPVKAAFKVLPLAELRKATAKMSAVSVQTRAAPAEVAPVAASRLREVRMTTPGPAQPYASGNGVVLEGRHLREDATGSSMLVCGVLYNRDLLYDVVYGKEDMTVTQEVPNRPGWTALNADFRKLPAGQHSYLLTLGHEADPKYVSFRVNGQDFTSDKLTYNAATSEVRLLFTYDATANGDTISVFARFSYPESAPIDFYSFHHIQLAMLE